MRRRLWPILLLLAGFGAQAKAGSDFDYWILALSWSPSWCAAEGDPDSAQCAPDRDLGFIVHGLWPQYERGWPEWCETAERDPPRRATGAMADVMGSGGLAAYQWRKHGRCSGLSARDYFGLTREARLRVAVPCGPQGAGADGAHRRRGDRGGVRRRQSGPRGRGDHRNVPRRAVSRSPDLPRPRPALPRLCGRRGARLPRHDAPAPGSVSAAAAPQPPKRLAAGGRRPNQGSARSISAESPISSESSPKAVAIWTPIGNPSPLHQSGSEAAGCPVAL